jgi:hypothetical protein
MISNPCLQEAPNDAFLGNARASERALQQAVTIAAAFPTQVL